jgi:hypothetical protein
MLDHEGNIVICSRYFIWSSILHAARHAHIAARIRPKGIHSSFAETHHRINSRNNAIQFLCISLHTAIQDTTTQLGGSMPVLSNTSRRGVIFTTEILISSLSILLFGELEP